MKKFVYEVAGIQFEDTEAFGKAWREAKALATEKHAAIYRNVISDRREVYTTGGCFVQADRVEPQYVAIL